MANDPQPKKFRYTLDIRGVEEEVLFNSPDGWLETKIEYKRSNEYNGLVRSLTLPMEFPYAGAGYLRREFAVYGLFANVKLYIDKLQNDWTYNRLFTGKLDFSKYIDKEETVEITAIEDTFSVKLDAFDEQQYAIPVDVPEAIDVELTPLTLIETADFIFTPNLDIRSDAFFEMRIVTNQQNSKEASVTDVGFFAQPDPDYSTDSHWYYRATVDTNVRHKGHLEGFIASQFGRGTVLYKIRVMKDTGSTVAFLFEQSTNTDPITFNFDFDFNVSVLAGERLFFYFENATDDFTNQGFQVTNSTLSLEYNTITVASMCKALRCDYIFTELVKYMNGSNTYPAVSYLLTNKLKQLVVTCTESIRQVNNIGTIYQAGDTLQIGGRYLVLGGAINYGGVSRAINTYFNYILGASEFTTTASGFVKQVGQNPSLSISFKDFYQSIYSIMGGSAGVGCETSRIVLEELSYFYRAGTVAIDFGEDIQAPEVLPATDLLWNKIKVGYEDQQYDQFNGNKEVMSLQYYSTDLTAVNKELNLVSVIRADPYGIETDRVVPTDTAASRSDNSNYFLYLKPVAEVGGYYRPLGMDALMDYSGVDASYYNWPITPKQNLWRGGSYLHSVLDKMDGYRIKLTDWKKNISLVTVDSTGRRIAEGEDIPIGNLPKQIFKPYYINVVPNTPYNSADLIDNSPYSEIRLTDLGSVWKGFINNVTTDEGMNEAQNFKLLMTPDNDLLKRVR